MGDESMRAKIPAIFQQLGKCKAIRLRCAPAVEAQAIVSGILSSYATAELGERWPVGWGIFQ